MRCTKILSPLNEHDNNPNIHEIAFQIFKKLVDMGLDVNFHLTSFFLKFAIKWKDLFTCLIMYSIKTDITLKL